MALEIPSWLNNQFIERILKKSENDDSIRVVNIVTKPATNKGDNYTSQMYRTTANFMRHQGSKQITDKKSLIIKTTLPDGPNNNLVQEAGLFDIEIKMMTNTLRDMESLLKDKKLAGKCYYTQDANPVMLVIEDLAPLGFRMADRQAGLDLEHCMLAISGIAKFHAGSVAACEKEPKYKEQYHKGIFNSSHPKEMKRFFIGGMKGLASVMKNWTDVDQHYSDKMMSVAEVSYDRASDSTILDDNEFHVINHGDYWVNNMLFRYDNEGKVIDHILVDFQLCLYGSPAIDLSYFFNTSPSEEVLQKYYDKLINEYLTILSATMKKIGCKTSPPTLADLKKSLNQKEIYGFVAACTILPIVLVDKADAQNLEEILGDDESPFNNKAYMNPAYERAICRRLPNWNRLGLLDA